MQFGICCMECLVRRHAKIAANCGDRDTGIAYLKDVMRAIADAPHDVAAPWLSPVFAQLAEKHFGAGGAIYTQLKQDSNRMMAELLPSLRSAVEASEDSLATALMLARACNYIDYSAFYDRVNRAELEQLLARAMHEQPERTEYARFRSDLSRARTLLYICDNAGEVFADRLLAEQLHRAYPSLTLTFCVRGSEALNDALRADALCAGLDTFGQIIDNGSGISGVELSYTGGELRHALAHSDVILAKGQGNFETMLGCGLNVYYLFLCKCERFTRFFDVPQLTGMFVSELNLPCKQFSD